MIPQVTARAHEAANAVGKVSASDNIEQPMTGQRTLLDLSLTDKQSRLTDEGNSATTSHD